MVRHVPAIKARLRLHAHRRVQGHLEGEYRSAHPGHSLDFNDLRAYVRGDDVKDMDWRASARTGQPLVRRFEGRRSHTVLLAVSTGRSMAAASTVGVSKRDLAVQAAGLLGLVALTHGDRVALAWGDAGRQRGRRPGRGELHLERCLAEVFEAAVPAAGPTNVAAVLDHIARTVRHRTLMLVVCDEHDVSEMLAVALRRAGAQHEVMVLTVGDLDPTSVPRRAGAVVDIDSGQRLPAWVRNDQQLAAEILEDRAAQRQAWSAACSRAGVVHEHLGDQSDAVAAVARLLMKQRHARRR